MFCHAGHSPLVFFTGCFKILTDSNLPSLNSGLETEETNGELHCDLVMIAL